MIPRLSIRIQVPQAPRWYSQQELADLWRCHPVTIRKLLMELRRAGMGPKPGQIYLKKINAARRFKLLRADYVEFMTYYLSRRMK